MSRNTRSVATRFWDHVHKVRVTVLLPETRAFAAFCSFNSRTFCPSRLPALPSLLFATVDSVSAALCSTPLPRFAHLGRIVCLPLQSGHPTCSPHSCLSLSPLSPTSAQPVRFVCPASVPVWPLPPTSGTPGKARKWGSKPSQKSKPLC